MGRVGAHKTKIAEPADYEIWNGSYAEQVFGVQGKGKIKIHVREACSGQNCPFHNPSDHPLNTAAINIRLDKMALVERICQHGVGHDDPDSVRWLKSIGQDWAGVHGCDGCCMKKDRNLADLEEMRATLKLIAIGMEEGK